LPSRLTRAGSRVGRRIRRQGAGHRDCTVARQPARPVFVSRGERLLDEHPTKGRRVDEEVATHYFAAIEQQALNEAIVGAQADIHDAGIHAPHARYGERIFAQVLRVERGVEVVGVREIREWHRRLRRRLRKALARSHRRGQRILTD
jgi:hypothetical protein